MKTFTYFKKSTFKFTFALIVFFAFQQINAQVKHVVQVSNTTFTPSDITISVGDTIEWQNIEGFHNVNGNQTAYTANPESFGNSTGNGWTYQHVFTIAGTYDYHCDPHVNLGMIGKVHVTRSYKKYIVEVTKNVFTPDELKINPGDTVEWRNIDGFHNVNGTQATYAMNPESFGNTTGVGWTFSHVFNAEGKYDYQCDPHVGLGMIGKIEVGDTGVIVDGKKMLTINFSGMNPHVGQTLWLSVTEKDSGKEIERRMETIAVDFSMQVSGLEMGHSYNIDFFADHNGNGFYDAPPADHAWRMELDNVMADTMLTFMHNTNFTDIMWKNKLMVNFMGMNPHVGQTLQLAVIDKNSGVEIDRVSTTAEVDFMVEVYGIETGMSYNIDFFADHNGNGSYDAPPADHAWRMELDNVVADTMLTFMHNTNFTDIMWKNKLMVNFMGMNPHVGQTLQLAVIDKNSGVEIDRVSTTAEVDFMVEVYGIETGMSYNIDFFADHNGNGSYDAPPADHAWRMELDNVVADTMLTFMHNTNFTDIMWKNKLTVHFMGMNPHVGQTLQLAVIDKNSGVEVDRVSTTAEVDFMVEVYGIETGMSYNIDFFADHNGNGSYDAPPADHAWRMELDNVMADTMLTFMHNTNFTDIGLNTGIQDLLYANIKMYPNPARNVITIETSDFESSELQVLIRDISGKTKLSLQKSFSGKTEVDIHSLSNGIYFVELRNSSQRTMMKLVKNK